MSLFNTGSTAANSWKTRDKLLLRFLVIYFVIQIVPLDWKFYRQIFSIDWSNTSYYDLFQLTRYYPRFFGWEGFGNWTVIAGIGLVGTLIWTWRENSATLNSNLAGFSNGSNSKAANSTNAKNSSSNSPNSTSASNSTAPSSKSDKNSTASNSNSNVTTPTGAKNSNRVINYDQVYYYLRVLLRYRLAAGIIAYGLIKFFPLQMPYPSLSNLHTNYGDFFAWKIYFHTLGVAQPYEVFLGAVEIAAGILLLFRKTATFGAGIIIGFTGNVFAANIFYDAGEQVYSAYLFVIAVILFLYDAPRLYRLLVQRKFTVANSYKPVFSTETLRKARRVLKIGMSVFIFLLGIATYANFTNAPYKNPRKPGLTGAYGFYNVREFKFNNQLIPYSTTDSNRWQNVIFEKWATASIKIAKPIKIDESYGDEYHQEDIDRNFESAGVGGRHYYAYDADTVQQSLVLTNKNKNHFGETFRLHYTILNDSSIVVQGVNEKNDSVYAVLDRITKKYMLSEGRRKRVKL